MANDCYNTIIFRSNNKKYLLSFFNTINDLLLSDKRTYSDLFKAYGIDVIKYPQAYPDLSFKGFIIRCSNCIKYNESECEYYFSVESVTVLTPLTETIDLLLSKITGNLTYYILAEEPNTGLFINTDLTGFYFPFRYNLDFVYSDILSYNESFQTIEDCYVSIYSKMGWKYTNLKKAKERLKKLEKKLNSNNEDFILSINEFDVY